MGIVSWPFIGMIRFFGCNRPKCCGSTDWHVKRLVTGHVVCGIMLLSIPPYPAAQPNTKICTVTLLLQEHWGCQSHNVNLGLSFIDVLLLKRVIVSMTQESSRENALSNIAWKRTSEWKLMVLLHGNKRKHTWSGCSLAVYKIKIWQGACNPSFLPGS